MKNKLLYILLSLSIIVLLLIIVNIVDIINVKKEKEHQKFNTAIKVLHIDLKNSELSITRGDKLNIDYDKKNIDVIINNKNIEIKEKNDQSSKVEIMIPDDFKFNQLSIISDKGNINLNDITCDFFSIYNEAGNVTMNKLNINNKTDLGVNSSKMNIKDSIIHNVDVFIGSGSLIYDGNLYGRSEIFTSDGKLEFNLKESIDNYRIEIEDNNKNIKVNNKIINNKSYTKGEKVIIIYGKGMLNINGE